MADGTDPHGSEEELRQLLQREQAECAEAEAAEAMFRGLLESVPDRIVIVDRTGCIILMNEFTSEEATEPGEALRASMERIQAIALVHDLLSQEQDAQTVDARAVIERLVPMVLRSGSVIPESLTLNVQVAHVSMPSKAGTSLALILNELVSNAIKHVFARRLGNCLHVSLQPSEAGLHLRVQDNGPGLSPEFNLTRHGNVGVQVVQTLAERYMAGRLILQNAGGLGAEVWFLE